MKSMHSYDQCHSLIAASRSMLLRLLMIIASYHYLVNADELLYLGDSCIIQENQSPGTCKFLRNCRESLQALQIHQKLPQTCGFEGTQPIVCCRNTNASTNNSPYTKPPVVTKRPIGTTTIQSHSNQRAPGAISKQMCREYARHAYSRERPPILLLDSVEQQERNECGFKVVELIVGGEKSKRKEFPHMALIGYAEEQFGEIDWLCGGSIISERFILTAGHCVTFETPPKYVKVGVTAMNEADAHAQLLAIGQTVPHPQYRPPSHYNDIALVRLQRAITLNPYARPACLQAQYAIAAQKSIASGWGKVDFAGERSSELLKVTLDLIEPSACNHSYRNQINRRLANGIRDDVQICAGSWVEHKDTCQGDSGGPLQIYHKGDDIKCMYDIVGVTSFGKACGNRIPGVYTRVSHFIDWIEKIVWP